MRTLIFIYQEQSAWVKWGSAKSSQFGIKNGTRQGSVLSPSFFAVYMDDLLQSLRDLGVGCHLGDIFVGAAGFADDIILLVPSRSAMKSMLGVVRGMLLRTISYSQLIKILRSPRPNACTCVAS